MDLGSKHVDVSVTGLEHQIILGQIRSEQSNNRIERS